MPPALDELLASPAGSKRVDLGGGVQAVREYDRVWLERGPVDLDGEVRWGAWRIASELPGLNVRGWRPGDRLAGRSKKIQDVFVDAKIPRSDREGWPLVVRGDEVVAVPGIVEAGVEAVRVRRRTESAPAQNMSNAELERAVGEILIDEDTLQARIAELGEEISPTTPAATCCSSACSRAPSSSWPT